MRRISQFLLTVALLAVSGLHAQEIIPVRPADTAHYYMEHSYDVLKYNITADIYHCYKSPYPKDFSATVEITFRVDSNLYFIDLNAVNASIQVDSVWGEASSFTHHSDTLRIQLGHVHNSGDIVSVVIAYHHKNVTDQAFYANSGYVFTDTPPEGSRKWFPCWDRPSDKALFELTAKVPLNVKLGSNGSLADSTIDADTLYYHWVSRDPIATYLITMTSKVDFGLDIVYLHRANHPEDSIPARFYFQSWQVPDSIEKVMGPMNDFFSSILGQYPFEKIGFASLNSSFPWGGMENQTMINLAQNGWQEGVVSHEFSHMWFGDLITCGTWADIWLNESFGTYCESLWLEHHTGTAAYKNHLGIQASYYLGHNPAIPIYNPSWAIHTPSPNLLYNTALVYYKGACVLHQLRYVMGDSAFFRLLYTYATDTSLMYKNAVTSDFIALTNMISGTDMGWFFDEWVYSPNHPVYSVSYEVKEAGAGKWSLQLLLDQTQTNTVFFKMPVQVKVVFADSTDTIITVVNDVNHQLYEFEFLKRPDSLFFDPDKNILLKKVTTTLGLDPSQENSGYRLFQNEPNPFSSSTTIRFQLPSRSDVKITVMDVAGREVIPAYSRQHDAGTFSYIVKSDNLPAGIYLYKMEAGIYNETRRMILAR
jgi:aminopeptidase N